MLLLFFFSINPLPSLLISCHSRFHCCKAFSCSLAVRDSPHNCLIFFCLKSKSHKNTLIQVLREVKDRSPFSWHTAYRIPFEASAASAAVSVAPWPAVPPLPRASTKSKMDTRRTETLADVENSMLKTSHFLELKWCANKDNLSSQCLVLARHLGMDLDMGVPGHFLLFDCFHHFMHSMHTNHKGTDDKGNCKAAVS